MEKNLKKKLNETHESTIRMEQKIDSICNKLENHAADIEAINKKTNKNENRIYMAYGGVAVTGVISSLFAIASFL